MAEDRMLSDEILLGLIKINSGGGGGGTTNYNQLENKPQIGGVTLTGNKTAGDLGLASENDLANKQDALLYGGVNPFSGADGDMYVKLARDESTLIDMFGSPSAESTDDYEMSYTVDSSVMGDYYDYEAFGTGKGFGQNGRGGMTITYHFKNSKFKPANVSYCNNFNLSGGGYLESANFAIKASNDGTNWDTLYSTTYPCPRDTIVSADIATNTYYSYFKFEMNSDGGYTGIRNIVMNGISESYSNIDNIYFKNDGSWLKDAFAKKSELDAKQDTLTFDDVPTANSNNPVKSGGVKSAIDAAVSSAYHHAGTKTCVELVAGLLVAANEGNVYNMTDSGTTTSDFIEGQGKPIKAGDNVGIAKISDGVYKFDLLSGFVDTSNFVQKSETAGLLKNDGTVDTTIQGNVSSLMSGLMTLDNEVNGDATVYPYADVITIPDAIPANVADCNVKIEPVQDLHGYDKPWVGGAGKNKLPTVLADIKTVNTDGTWSGNAYTVNGVTFTVNTDDDGNVTGIIVNGTATVNTYFDLVSVFNSSEYAGMIYNGSPSNNATVRVSGGDRVAKQDLYNGDTIWNSGDGLKIAIRVTSAITINNEIFKPMIRLATETDATFAPYTNICPITGHTEASVTVVDDAENPTVTKTYTIALGDTIYGGTVDFKTGVMTVDRAFVEFDGDESWQITQSYDDGSKVFSINGWAAANNAKADSGISSKYKRTPSLANDLYAFRIVTGFNIRDKYDTLDAFKASLSSVALQVCYELATPITIQLTPQQIQLLKGTNTLTASMGDISVTVNGVSGAIGALTEDVAGLQSGLDNITPTLVYTSPTTGTYGDKLDSVKTAFNNLSSAKKKKSYIMLGGSTKYTVSNWNDGIFNASYYDAANSAFKFLSINLSSTGDVMMVMLSATTNGNSIESRVNVENSNTFALYA